MTDIDFSILSGYVTVIYLRFIKNTNFYVIKQKNKTKQKNSRIFPCYLSLYIRCAGFSASKLNIFCQKILHFKIC